MMTHIGLREIVMRTRARGPADTTKRAVRRLYSALSERLDLRTLDFPLDDGDIFPAARSVLPLREPASGEQRIGWLCTPPGAGSGGHTTLFRMVRGMEERGHRCTILLYNRHHGDMERHCAVIRRSWPELAADIVEMPAVLGGFDACVASSWETAHVLAARAPSGSQLGAYYFIQDYEPYFYPRGSLYALAEDSYRFGFTHLALGEMVAGTLRREVGVDAHVIPFGSDAGGYRRTNTGDRSGVVFFARPDTDRRGYDLGRLALREFHRLHPEQDIHIFGSQVRGWGIPVTQHGMLPASELSALYNRTLTGLALSFTNITLVAAEMLAAGNIAVLNDHEFSRSVLTNPEAVWAAPSPASLALALSSVVTDPGRIDRSARASAHPGPSWAIAQAEVALKMSGVSQ
ncbi:glycosyltransferase family 1 protein [Arthrobacter oryzae]|uniref:rhamnosyltransferase WsaF family glycosyltransferase n=1 Tax=Arthrobacter oryzae TaxID=409290 RepID=UPI0028679BEB|nr:glycosyltransferase family 1 protein [Arthrobacter oryzae]MDR6504448.1 hypothetical protein [Arthrobacter oryzae]